MALLAAIMAVGAALLSAAGRTAVGHLSWPERVAFAFLLGAAAGGLVTLFILLGGARYAGWWWAVLGVAGLSVSAVRRSVLSHPANQAKIEQTATERVVGVGMLGAFLWAAVLAFHLPPTDYDSLAIWGHRLQVLLEERVLVTPSLRDPLRFVAQPLHPYLVTVLEASFCVAAGGYSAAARNLPYLLMFGCYLVLVAGAARRLAAPWRRLALLAGAGLMPVLPSAAVWLSAREFLMAVLGFACVRAMILWIESGSRGAALLAALLAVATQQVKIEGLPLSVGFLAGVAFWGLFGGMDRGAGLRTIACAATVFILMIPWSLARQSIPPVHVEGLVKGFDISLVINGRYLLEAVRVMTAEVFARPELYGLAGLAVLAGLATGWQRATWRQRVAILLPPALLLAAILANLSARVGEGPDRLLSLPRRMMIVMPALLLASLAVFPTNRCATTSADE
ncbi:MAG: hypothetical protein N2111_09635 [Candidatus Sumerlaeaceae bacterium]|nr:hypothetical protein [Candidatus Sumerlaeaceae bacterium]